MKALIFDFDGVIVDTETCAVQAWEETYASYGCQLEVSTWADWIGSRVTNVCEDIEQRTGRAVDCQEVRTSHRQRMWELSVTQPILPGVEAYIADAKRLGMKLAIASSSPREWVAGHLTRIGLLEHFDSIKCGDEVPHTKPHPDLFNAALEALDVRAAQAIVLEDSPNGVLAAKRAGIFCVAIPGPMTRHLNLGQADMSLKSLADMPLESLLQHIADQDGRDGKGTIIR